MAFDGAHIEEGKDFDARLKALGIDVDVQTNALVKSGWPPEYATLYPATLVHGASAQDVLPGYGIEACGAIYSKGMIIDALGEALGPAAPALAANFETSAQSPDAGLSRTFEPTKFTPS